MPPYQVLRAGKTYSRKHDPVAERFVYEMQKSSGNKGRKGIEVAVYARFFQPPLATKACGRLLRRSEGNLGNYMVFDERTSIAQGMPSLPFAQFFPAVMVLPAACNDNRKAKWRKQAVQEAADT